VRPVCWKVLNADEEVKTQANRKTYHIVQASTLPKAVNNHHTIKVKVDKLNYMKIKFFCESKDTINKVEWEKISANHLQMGVLSRVQKEHL
jgi:hypothetical protein